MLPYGPLGTDPTTVEHVAKALHASRYKDRAVPWDEVRKDFAAYQSWRSEARDFIARWNKAFEQ